MKKIIIFISKINEKIATFFVGLLVFTMILQIFFRKILNNSLSWTDEFASYMLVWIALFGSVMALFEGKHIAINLLVKKLRYPFSNICRITAYLVMIIFCLLIFFYSIPLLQKTLNVYAISLRVSKAVIYSALPITMFGMILILINDILNEIIFLFNGNKKQFKETNK